MPLEAYGTTSYIYQHDRLGRQTQETITLPGGPVPVVVQTAAYLADGLRSSLTGTVGGAADFSDAFEYDYLHRMKEVRQGSQQGSANVAAKRVTLGYNGVDQFDTIARYGGPSGMTLGAEKRPQLASGSVDQTVRLWDLGTSEQHRELGAHDGYVWSAAFSPDGRAVVSGGADRVVKLWDPAAGQEVRAWDFRLPVLPSKPFVRNLAFAGDGKQVVTANATLSLLEGP